MFFKRAIEVKKVREVLSANAKPVDEDVFSSALSYGRCERFDMLNSEEFKGLKRFMEGLTHDQMLEGIYSIAYEIRVISEKEISDTNDQKIIDYLRNSKVIDSENRFRLKNVKGNLITFNFPLKKQSVFALSMLSNLLGQVYLKRSSEVN